MSLVSAVVDEVAAEAGGAVAVDEVGEEAEEEAVVTTLTISNNTEVEVDRIRATMLHPKTGLLQMPEITNLTMGLPDRANMPN